MPIFRWFRLQAQRSISNRELDAELRAHVAHRADDLERGGMTRAEAERRARVEFGGYVRIKEESRDALGRNRIESIWHDIRYSVRMLRKSPGFTVAAVITLALGIGANAVVFSVMNALILRPLNLPESQNLYSIDRGSAHTPSQSYPDYVDLRDRTHSFDGMAAYEIVPAGLEVDGNSRQVWTYLASGNYFDVLGVKPYLGRFFHAADEHGENSAPYVVLSYPYWQGHFNSDASVVGRVVEVNKKPFTILGVAPKGFRGSELFYAPDLWAPIMEEQIVMGYDGLKERSVRGLWLVARFKHGVTIPQAKADLQSVARYLQTAYPKDDDKIQFGFAHPGLLGDMLGGPVRAFMAGLMLLAGLILLGACANLGALFAARAADRAKEVALRLALGSSRARIVRQLLAEAVLVALGGAVMGTIATIVLLRWLSAWQPVPSIPINITVQPDAATYAVALALAIVSGLLFGAVPMRQVLKADPYQVVKVGNAAAIGRRVTLRDVLLIAQIAVCAVLVTASLVAVRGMVRSMHSSFGFNPDGAFQVYTDLDMAGYKGDQVIVMRKRLTDAVAEIPGIKSVAFADRIPLDLGWSDSYVFSDAATDYRSSQAMLDAMQYSVSPGYFQTASTKLLAGREISWHDVMSAPKVAVVNSEFARKGFGSPQKAVGSFFKIWGGKRVQIVGVVETGRYRTLAEDPTPAMFLSILQWTGSDMWMIVRSDRSLSDLGPAIESAAHGVDPSLPLVINSWNRELDTALFAPHAATIALGVLGGLGAMLAITGVFGMASYSVTKRMREIGIRIALGAQKREVLGTALGRSLKLLGIGSVVGLGLGVAASRVLAAIVYQATPRDPVVLGGVVVAMVLLGLVATWIPASRALRADPLLLLREE